MLSDLKSQECPLVEQEDPAHPEFSPENHPSVVVMKISRCNVQFADAPLIHPWNVLKYDAGILRARAPARSVKKIVLWCVAEDRPLTAEHRNLTPEELDIKRGQWAT